MLLHGGRRWRHPTDYQCMGNASYSNVNSIITHPAFSRLGPASAAAAAAA